MATKLSDEDIAKLAELLNTKVPNQTSGAVVAPASPPSPVRSARTTRKSFRLRDIIPEWGYDAAQWMMLQHDVGGRAIAGLLTILVFIIGVALLFGDGYTSIQGVRIPLSMLGLSVKTTGIPSIWWWMLPLLMTLFEIFGKHVPGLKPFWYPCIFFDGMTTALYVATGLGRFFASAGHMILLPASFWQLFSLDVMTGILIVSLVSGVIGLCLAIFAEQVFLSSLVMLWGVLFGKRR